MRRSTRKGVPPAQATELTRAVCEHLVLNGHEAQEAFAVRATGVLVLANSACLVPR